MSNRSQYIAVRSLLALRRRRFIRKLIGNGTTERFSRPISSFSRLRVTILHRENWNVTLAAIAAFNSRRWYRATNFSRPVSLSLSFAAVNYSLVFQRFEKGSKKKTNGIFVFLSARISLKCFILHRDAKCLPVIITVWSPVKIVECNVVY